MRRSFLLRLALHECFACLAGAGLKEAITSESLLQASDIIKCCETRLSVKIGESCGTGIDDFALATLTLRTSLHVKGLVERDERRYGCCAGVMGRETTFGVATGGGSGGGRGGDGGG